MEYISPNCTRILGLDEEQLEDYDNFMSRLSETDSAALYQLFHSGVLRSQAELNLKLEVHGQRESWLLLKVYPILVDDQVVRYIISISDQTEALLAQQNLRDALALAQKANDAKKDFLSRMSHEIRTPMNAIIGMATIAAANIQDQRRVEDCLTKIGFSSKHLLSLINDVLDMSKIEEGKLTISREPFEFRQLIQSITAIIDSQARSRNQNFEATVVDFTEEVIIGDSNACESDFIESVVQRRQVHAGKWKDSPGSPADRFPQQSGAPALYRQRYGDRHEREIFTEALYAV